MRMRERRNRSGEATQRLDDRPCEEGENLFARLAQGRGGSQGRRLDRGRPETQVRRADPEDGQFNDITDIGARWYRNDFYFISTYACPGPNALSPTFEAKFARMEHLGGGLFALHFMRHTGEWVGLYDALSVDECMNAIGDDSWFVP